MAVPASVAFSRISSLKHLVFLRLTGYICMNSLFFPKILRCRQMHTSYTTLPTLLVRAAASGGKGLSLEGRLCSSPRVTPDGHGFSGPLVCTEALGTILLSLDIPRPSCASSTVQVQDVRPTLLPCSVQVSTSQTGFSRRPWVIRPSSSLLSSAGFSRLSQETFPWAETLCSTSSWICILPTASGACREVSVGLVFYHRAIMLDRKRQ